MDPTLKTCVNLSKSLNPISLFENWGPWVSCDYLRQVMLCTSHSVWHTGDMSLSCCQEPPHWSPCSHPCPLQSVLHTAA